MLHQRAILSKGYYVSCILCAALSLIVSYAVLFLSSSVQFAAVIATVISVAGVGYMHRKEFSDSTHLQNFILAIMLILLAGADYWVNSVILSQMVH